MTFNSIPIGSIDSQRPHKPVMLEEILKYLVHETKHFEVHLLNRMNIGNFLILE